MPNSQDSGKSDIPTYEDAIEPVNTHPVEISVQPKDDGGNNSPRSSKNSRELPSDGHGAPEIIGDISAPTPPLREEEQARRSRLGLIASRGHGWFQYMKTKEFWIVLLLGYVSSMTQRPPH